MAADSTADASTALAGAEHDVPIGPMTTFGIGGPARLLLRARTSADIVRAIRWARATGTPWFLLGTGANILVGDGGFDGLVIRNESSAVEIDGHMLRAGTGADMADLIAAAADSGLSGIEHYAGIPSTLGGALWQNLHFLSPDRSRTMFIEEVVEHAVVLTADDEIIDVDRAWFEFGYDQSRLHGTGHVALEATLRLQHADEALIRDTSARNLAWRAEKHPPGATSCSAGSIFQKAEGLGAGRLIDQCGLKGHSIGGAQISPVHANFIVNTGTATAADVRQLIAHAQQCVQQRFDVLLQPEISFVGEFIEP